MQNVSLGVIKDLELNNIEIIKAYDGVDALALFKIDHYVSQTIDLIISDHNMSMMDGCDFVNLVERYRLGRDIKLMISSTDNEILKDRGLKFVDFLNKPASKIDIKNILKK